MGAELLQDGGRSEGLLPGEGLPLDGARRANPMLYALEHAPVGKSITWDRAADITHSVSETSIVTLLNTRCSLPLNRIPALRNQFISNPTCRPEHDVEAINHHLM
jgi:hypothetical protein